MEHPEEFHVGGKGTAMVFVLVIITMMLRVFSLSDSDDAQLQQKVRQQLWLSYATELGQEIEAARQSGNFDRINELLAKSSADAIAIEKVAVSEPLLSWSSSENVIIEVTYRLPDESVSQTRYMRFNHSAAAGWNYRFNSNAFSYYTNLF